MKLPPLPPLPAYPVALAPFDVPFAYWKAAQSLLGKTLENARILLRGGRAGIINDDVSTNGPILIRNVRLEIGAGENEHTEWGFRLYFGTGGTIENVEIVDLSTASGPSYMDEHADYTNFGRGNILIRGFSATNIPAQAIQLRHTKNRADPNWKLPRLVTLEEIRAKECGQKRGAGRAGFTVSIKDAGPESVIHVRRMEIECVEQRGVVKNSAGQICDSFGALCIEYAQHVEIDELYINHRKPDKNLVQLYDQARTTVKQSASHFQRIKRNEIVGGNLAVRINGGVKLVEVAKGTGNGLILVHVWDRAQKRYIIRRRIKMADGFTYKG